MSAKLLTSCVAFGDLAVFWLWPRVRLDRKGMKLTAVLLLALGLTSPGSAESCSKSRDYILEGLAGDLSAPAALYRESFKICLETLALGNVQDAYVLKDGSIGIIPSRNTIFATAETLAQFCQRFPKSTVRFLSSRSNAPIGSVVLAPSADATSCKKILGSS